MGEFNLEQKKIIFNAIRYYQMHRVPLNGVAYELCDSILNSIFSEVKNVPDAKLSTNKGKHL